MDLDLQPFELDLVEPLRTADRTIESRRGFLVRVRTEDRRGLGEATPLPGWTESYDACEDALERAADRLSVRGPDATLDELADAPAARHGLSLAIADLRARRIDVPLLRELGGGSRSRHLRVNATIGDASVSDTVEAAEHAVADGFDCLKLKVGARSLDEDAERLEAVRSAVGADVTLRADANEAWDRATAEAAFERFADASVSYVEQPLNADDLIGHAKLRGGSVDVALDETLAVANHDRVLDVDAADVIVCKPMVLGGPDRTIGLARRGRRAGVRPVVSTTIDGVVARLGALHVAGALAPIDACGLATGDRLANDLGPDPAPVEDGTMTIPRGAGTGLRLADD
ncbi:chloromuconate cycloisomerase [Salinarchaeum sp. Harcht-Bsk1]|uniref:mandelate racemase/muconate lactonizing enzyme family protein n=1 Tax=Salinarchaeum sp. Harcht-Bsk1 TaxID=1333523 RepID=UPI0003424137|nr:o-succinylbenzoate synthase [Salinarchaeum sp. Harcht-Bsk1]AGN02920.1 chloromuconate cycloisomerase [Salinarchaeum sp. Harcht-Bsk1]